jgi:benzoyl-CoA reductase/2-hydroxyglutaryl-CoA dehydratase subunit BcrC/BadD/HgdB
MEINMTADKDKTYESALTSFLELCEFTPDQIKAEWPRITKTFDIWEINTAEDFEAASKMAKYLYDLSFKGLRMALGIYIRELCNLTLCGEEKDKRIYTVMPCNIPDLITAYSMKYPSIYSGFPDMIAFMTIGNLFDRTGIQMDKAEERYFSPGEAHCSCCKLRTASLFDGKYAKPDLIVSYSHYCDSTWKTDEMLKINFDIPFVVIDRTQDEHWENGMSIDWRRLRFYVEQLKHAQKEIDEILGVDMGEEDFMGALVDTGNFNDYINKMVGLAVKTDPAPITFHNLLPFLWLFMSGCAPENRPLRLKAAETLYEEVKERAEKGEGPLPEGAPRYIAGGFGTVMAPEIYSFLEEQGLCFTSAEACYWMPDATFEAPMLGQVEATTPSEEFTAGGVGVFEALAVPFFQNAISNSQHARVIMFEKVLDRLASEKYPIDGVIMPGNYACRVYGTDCHIMKDTIDKKGIPAMALEFDQFDRRYYTLSAVTTKLEAFAEIVKMHQAMST